MPLKYEVSMLMLKCTCAPLWNVLTTSILYRSGLIWETVALSRQLLRLIIPCLCIILASYRLIQKSHSYARTHYKTSNKNTRPLRVIKKNSFILMACNLITMMLVSRKILRKYIWQYWKSFPQNASEKRINFVATK